MGADNTRGATIIGAEETTLYRTSFVRRTICMRGFEYEVQKPAHSILLQLVDSGKEPRTKKQVIYY